MQCTAFGCFLAVKIRCVTWI